MLAHVIKLTEQFDAQGNRDVSAPRSLLGDWHFTDASIAQIRMLYEEMGCFDWTISKAEKLAADLKLNYRQLMAHIGVFDKRKLSNLRVRGRLGTNKREEPKLPAYLGFSLSVLASLNRSMKGTGDKQ